MSKPLIFFSVILFIVGIVLIALTISAQQSLPDTCDKSSVNIAMNIVLVLGVMLCVIPLTFFVCSQSCSNCNVSGEIWYKSILGSIGVILAICGGVIWNGVSDCYVPNVQNYGLWLMIIGIVLPVSLLIYNYKNGIMKAIKPAKKIKPESSEGVSI